MISLQNIKKRINLIKNRKRLKILLYSYKQRLKKKTLTIKTSYKFTIFLKKPQ